MAAQEQESFHPAHDSLPQKRRFDRAFPRHPRWYFTCQYPPVETRDGVRTTINGVRLAELLRAELVAAPTSPPEDGRVLEDVVGAPKALLEWVETATAPAADRAAAAERRAATLAGVAAIAASLSTSGAG